LRAEPAREAPQAINSGTISLLAHVPHFIAKTALGKEALRAIRLASLRAISSSSACHSGDNNFATFALPGPNKYEGASGDAPQAGTLAQEGCGEDSSSAIGARWMNVSFPCSAHRYGCCSPQGVPAQKRLFSGGLSDCISRARAKFNENSLQDREMRQRRVRSGPPAPPVCQPILKMDFVSSLSPEKGEAQRKLSA
jgi:hypothetical protein